MTDHNDPAVKKLHRRYDGAIVFICLLALIGL